MKKTLFALCAVCSVFLFSGCQLFDIISDAISNFWGSPQVVDVLILPPLPLFNDGEDSGWNQRLANCDSKSIEQAMMKGVNSFNDGTRRTKIVPIYYANKESVKMFYEEVALKAMLKDYEEGTDKNLRQTLGEFLKMENQDRKSDGSNYNFKCLVCGFYRFNRNAQANNIQLVHYDIVKNDLATANGLVSKEEGFEQNSDLERLMTTLLQRAYGK